MKSLTVAFVTSRVEPKIKWFLDSLDSQIADSEEVSVIIVDHYADGRSEYEFSSPYLPKPNIWQGRYRLTKDEWWAKSNALNTAICLCQTEWISFVDDRSVLMPGWLDRVKAAMKGKYAVCGRYEKHFNMIVESGMIIDPGHIVGLDDRPLSFSGRTAYRVKSYHGGHGALPLEWCLQVNGFPELCDSVGMEDSMFGHQLYNSGFELRYDSEMMIIEDRTPGQIEDGALKRADFGVSPNDKSHAIRDRLMGSGTSQNTYDIRELRDKVLRGEPFPLPPVSATDWYDDKDIATKFDAL